MDEKKNFIRTIESDYSQLKAECNSSQGFIYLKPVKVVVNSVKNDSFTIKHYVVFKNNHRTQFLYCRNCVRVYFSDVDILQMLLQIEDAGKQGKILNALSQWLWKGSGEGYIEYEETSYSFQTIDWCDNSLVFHTHKDIDVPEKDVIALINLIVAKDVAVTKIGNGMHDFAKRTINKYLALLKWYWFKDKSVYEQLKSISYRTEKDLISNFPPGRHKEWKDLDLRFQKIDVD